jgi:hypothetical protein
MRTKTQCFSEVCDFIRSQTSLYEAIKTQAEWTGTAEESKLSVINAVNYWFKDTRYSTEFRTSPTAFFQLNYFTWLRNRKRKFSK